MIRFQSPGSTPKVNIIVNFIIIIPSVIIAIIVILSVAERSFKQTRDTGAEIDVVEVLDEMYRIHVALLMANDHVGQAVLVYILFPTLNRSLCCTERPLVAARHQIGTQLHDLRCFRLLAS